MKTTYIKDFVKAVQKEFPEMNLEYLDFAADRFMEEQPLPAIHGEGKWTDSDIDAAYIMGAINSDAVQPDEKDTFPSPKAEGIKNIVSLVCSVDLDSSLDF